MYMYIPLTDKLENNKLCSVAITLFFIGNDSLNKLKATVHSNLICNLSN